MNLQPVKLAMLTLSVALLSGCVADTDGGRESSSTPVQSVTVTESDQKVDLKDDQKLIIRSENSASLSLGGSGTCPPVIESATYKDNTLKIVLDSNIYDGQMCTMDYKIKTFDFTLTGDRFSDDTTGQLINGSDVINLEVVKFK